MSYNTELLCRNNALNMVNAERVTTRINQSINQYMFGLNDMLVVEIFKKKFMRQLKEKRSKHS